MFLKKLLNLKAKTPKGKTVSGDANNVTLGRKEREKKIKRKKGDSNMENEIKEEKEEKKEEVKEETKKVDEPVKETEVTEKVEDEKSMPNEVTQIKEPEQNDPLLGVRVEDIVTKNDLSQALASLSAKLDAVIKENEDLKNKLTEVKGENEGLRNKYEDKDFGSMSKQGFTGKQESAYESYDDYFKKF